MCGVCPPCMNHIYAIALIHIYRRAGETAVFIFHRKARRVSPALQKHFA
jgi:hypothetical protein